MKTGYYSADNDYGVQYYGPVMYGNVDVLSPEDFYDSLLDDVASFPYTVITPAFNGFIHRENEKLISSQDSNIFIIENANNQLNTTSYAIDNISYIEVGTILQSKVHEIK